jgi:hypothetical protein
MNLHSRLDNVAKRLPTKQETNPFDDMTDEQFDRLMGELGELVKTEAEQDPTTLDKLDPALLSLLRNEGLLDK